MGTKSRTPLKVHPGEILDHEFLRPNGLDADGLARAIGAGAGCVASIIEGRQSISHAQDILARLTRDEAVSVHLTAAEPAEDLSKRFQVLGIFVR